MLDSIKRVDAIKKLTGQALYAADLRFENMVHVKVRQAGVAHALIRCLDTSRALMVPGVIAVLTSLDIPGTAARPLERPVLCSDRVRYAGDGISLVVAETEHAAAGGVDEVEVDLELLPAVASMEAAMAPDAPVLHDGSNQAVSHVLKTGDVEQAFQLSDLVLERTYHTSLVQAAAIETEAAVACLDAPDQVTVYCPCKSPFNVRRHVAETLGWQLNQVRIIQAVVGGSFGSKDSDIGILASRVALATVRTGRPARCVLSREESMLECTKRHPYTLTYKIGVTKDGRILGMRIRGVADAGAYFSKTGMVIFRSTVEATGPYRVPAVDTELQAVYTNNPVSDALRGFGSPQVNFAVELLMDEVAEHLGIDPLELRRKNVFTEGDAAPFGQPMVDVGAASCLQAVSDACGWGEEHPEPPPGHAYGRGLSCCFRGSSLGAGGEGIDAAAVSITINRDGSIYLTTGISEVGQGSHTVFSNLVKEAFDVPLDLIKVNPVDTSYAYDSGPTVASRGTSLGGRACLKAIETLRETLVRVAAQRLNVPAKMLYFRDAQVGDGRVKIDWLDLVEHCYRTGIHLNSFGWYKAPDLTWNRENGQGSPYFSYTYAAAVAEVDVDLTTGEVKVMHYYAAHDVGNALNPDEVNGQIGGGVAMGIGYALSENIQSPGKEANLDRYLIPTSQDMAALTPIIVEVADRFGPIGAKGLGEPATEIVAPTIINAICSVLKTRIYELPAGLEQVMTAIERMKLSEWMGSHPG